MKHRSFLMKNFKFHRMINKQKTDATGNYQQLNKKNSRENEIFVTTDNHNNNEIVEFMRK